MYLVDTGADVFMEETGIKVDVFEVEPEVHVGWPIALSIAASCEGLGLTETPVQVNKFSALLQFARKPHTN